MLSLTYIMVNFVACDYHLMLYFFMLHIHNLKNTASVFNKSRYSCVSYLENMFATSIGEGTHFRIQLN